MKNQKLYLFRYKLRIIQRLLIPNYFDYIAIIKGIPDILLFLDYDGVGADFYQSI